MQKNTSNKVDHLLVEHVVAAVNEVKGPDRASALYKCINEVCTQLEWPIGHVYFPAEDNPTRLEPSTLWFCDNPDQYKVFRDITKTTPFEIGAGLPGRVLKTKKPAWIADVTKDTNFPRANRAQDIGVKAAFAFPVILHSEVIAVLEFFHPLAIEPDEQILAVMEDIGKQVREVILRNSIRPEKLDAYKKDIEVISQQVVRLNSHFYCIKRIHEFPFGLFKHENMPFWILVVDSMFESLVMIIYKILIDNDGKGGKTLTLKKLKNKIVNCFIKEEYKEQFNKTWNDLLGKNNEDLKDVTDKLKTLRHKHFAHFDIKFNTDISDKSIEKQTFSLPEIDKLIKYINSLFQMLSLGRDFLKTALYYPPDAKNPSDIEILLDTIAKESDVMHMPEKDKKDPDSWKAYRREIVNDHQIEIFNKYRKKLKLPPA